MPPDRPSRPLPPRPNPSRYRPAARRTSAAALLAWAVLAAGLPACRSRTGDTVLPAVARVLVKGDRLIALRALDPAATRIAAVVGTKAGKPELRIYESEGGRKLDQKLVVSQGDAFKNLALMGVDLDGQEEIVVTWEGGHLEMIDVISRAPAGAWRSIFQYAGRQVEARYDQAGRVEFWITSRTYQEGPRQEPDYETAVYRWDKGGYAAAPRP